MTPPHLPIQTGQPHRLGRDPRHLGVEVGRSQTVQLQPTLIRDMTARGRGPEQSGVVLLASAGTDSPHRQGAVEASRVRVTQGGLYVPTLGIHIPDLRAQQLRRHAHQPAPSAT